MAPAALLFDLDGTLVDSAAGIATALSVVRRERGGDAVTPEHVRPLVSLGAETLVRQTLGPFARDDSGDLAAFRLVLSKQAPDPAAIHAGVVNALTALERAGHPMAVVTNKPEELSHSLLDGLGLTRYFAAIVGGDTAGSAKPDPAPVEWALRRLGARSDQAVFIGDSEIDAGVARACAMPFILFEGGYGADACLPRDISARFGNFAALPALVAQVAASRPLAAIPRQGGAMPGLQ